MEWKASHILVSEYNLARRLQMEIKQGARFEDLARRHSSCPSRSSGGDLGWFGPGKMAKDFEDACRKVGVGDRDLEGPDRGIAGAGNGRDGSQCAKRRGSGHETAT